jgi:hypothetical protein
MHKFNVQRPRKAQIEDLTNKASRRLSIWHIRIKHHIADL